MAAGNLQGNMPVLISVQQPGSANSWPEPEEPSASTAAEENIPFTRPAITTGAHLPWQVSKRSSYSVPRAICSLQTVPPITLLSNRKEATKLVYSKDSENASTLVPPESPFKSKSQVSLYDEELIEHNVDTTERPAPPQTARHLDSLDPLEGDRLGSNQASSGFMPPRNSNPHSSIAGHMPHQGMQSGRSFPSTRMQSRFSSAYPAQHIKMEPALPRWNGPALDVPVAEEEAILQAEIKQEPVPFTSAPAQINPSYPTESPENVYDRASSLYKSSGDSSQLRMAEIAANTDVSEPMDGSSRSQSLADKRKSESIEALASSPENDALLFQKLENAKENLVEQRAVRRRITNRASAMRTAEKKNLEQNRLERTYEKLASENSELIIKLKRQTKACSDLKLTLEATREKLRVSEDVNGKLRSEMQFLRNNLAMLPQPQASIEIGTGLDPDVGGSPASAHWNSSDFLFPTQMPTQAEIAADLELDRQLLHSDCGHEYLKEWQMY